jgi:hypothetical protein
MRHQVINAQLLRQARAAIDAEARERPAPDTGRDRRVLHLLLWTPRRFWSPHWSR